MNSATTNYILSNEEIALGGYESIYYKGIQYPVTECPMTGSYSFQPYEGDELTVIGFVELQDDKFVRIYAADQDTYDTIMETVSVTEKDDLQQAYYLFNDVVFGKSEAVGFGDTYFDVLFITYDNEGNSEIFESEEDAKAYAESINPEN